MVRGRGKRRFCHPLQALVWASVDNYWTPEPSVSVIPDLGKGWPCVQGSGRPFLCCSLLFTLPLLLMETWKPHTDLNTELHIHVHFSTEGFWLYIDVISWLDQEKRSGGQKGLSESQVQVNPGSWVLCGEEAPRGETGPVTSATESLQGKVWQLWHLVSQCRQALACLIVS